MKQERKSKNYGAISRSITYIIRTSEEKREGSIRNIYSDNGQNIFKFMTDTKPQIQETPNTLNKNRTEQRRHQNKKKKSTFKHFIFH